MALRAPQTQKTAPNDQPHVKAAKSRHRGKGARDATFPES